MNTGFFIATPARATALGAAARAGSMKRDGGGVGKCWLGGMGHCCPKSYQQLDPRENTTLPGEGHT